MRQFLQKFSQSFLTRHISSRRAFKKRLPLDLNSLFANENEKGRKIVLYIYQ